MQGLRQRPTYDEVIDYLELHQEKIKYPDRRATFLRNSPYLTQFDNDSWIDLDEQERKIMEGQMRDIEMKKLMHNSNKTHSETKAVGFHTTKPIKRTDVFDTESDKGSDEYYDPVEDNPSKNKKFEDLVGLEALNPQVVEAMKQRGLNQQPSGSSSSALKSIVMGVGNVAANYVIPAVGEVAYATATQVVPAVARLVFSTTWLLADILLALRAAHAGGRLGSEDSSNPQYRNSHLSIGDEPKTTKEEYMKQFRNKGALVEEIYKRPGWIRVLGVAMANGNRNDDTAVFRSRLAKMTKADLATILTNLD